MDWSALAAVLDAIAWPVVLLIGFVVLRRPLSEIVPTLLNRASKITIGDFGVELVAVTELAPTWSAESVDVRSLTASDVFDSRLQSLFEQLANPVQSDFAIVDLGAGDKWLSSRLFIFALVLGEVSGLKAFVFVETAGPVTASYVGLASPEAVRHALARRFPWLELSLIAARNPEGADPATYSEPMDLAQIAVRDSWRLPKLVQTYVASLQQSVPPPADHEHEWETFSAHGQRLWERTAWLNGVAVQEVLGSQLHRSDYTIDPDRSRQERFEAILRRSDEFVAMLDRSGRFERLVDRAETVENFVSEMLEAAG